MVNFSISVPMHIARWLEDHAKANNLRDRKGDPSLAQAAQNKLTEAYMQECEKK